jgi:hypothetical protein
MSWAPVLCSFFISMGRAQTVIGRWFNVSTTDNRNRKEKETMKRAIIALSAMAAIAALVVWLPAVKCAVATPTVVHAQNENGGCSLASLNGPYATEGQGTIVGQLPGLPPPPFPFGEVVLDHFNGAGSFFGNASVNLGGVALPVSFTGTYTVNSDCTGTVTVNTSLGLTLHNAMVVIGGGQRFILTQTDPFAVIQRTGVRLGD